MSTGWGKLTGRGDDALQKPDEAQKPAAPAPEAPPAPTPEPASEPAKADSALPELVEATEQELVSESPSIETVEPAETAPEEAPTPPPPSALLKAEGLQRWLGEAEARTHALRGVDLILEPGQAYSVVGPSGCGKSTLLYLLGLLDRPDAGEIWIAGDRMSTANDAERTAVRNEHIGFVFQFHFLLPEFSALENVMLPMRKQGRMSNNEMRSRAQELLDAVGLGKKAGRSTGHLSGGEQQRVAVARSLANSPGIILADEPTGNLDAHNSSLIFDLLLRVAHDMQQAVLIVSHNMDMAVRCDQVLRMRDGLFELLD